MWLLLHFSYPDKHLLLRDDYKKCDSKCEDHIVLISCQIEPH